MPKGKIGFQKGHKSFLTEESIKKLCGKTGEKNNMWAGGTMKYWRVVVIKRDDYTCQKCDLRDLEIMVVDHVKPKAMYPELFLDLKNLVTLCPNCHARKTIKDRKEIAIFKRLKK